MSNSTLDIKLSNDELAISQIMNRMIYLIVPCILASLCYTIYTGQNKLQIFALIFSSSSIFILTFLVNKNKIQLAKVLLVVILHICMTILVFAQDGLFNSALLGLALLQLISILLLNGKYTYLYALYGFTLLVTVGVMDLTGINKHPFVSFVNIGRLIDLLLVYAISTLTISFIARTLKLNENKAKLFAHSLQELNQELDKKVEIRTRELAEANIQIQQAMEQLVHSEKLASLGGMVAGIAHELNTPIGNALTISSTLKYRISDFRSEIENGQVKKSTITQFLSQADEIADVVERNCKRAAELVTSFKQVAVDQTSMRHRKFYLEELLKELILTLKPQFKRSQIELKLEAEADILMESYPGALEQVLTNFITNALLHAFQSDQSGVITIHAFKSEDNKVTIIHQDNGLGISPEIQKKVFDPFFTTKLGQGGSGLGLYLVFNFVTRVLQGNIRLESQPGCTLFILTLPLILREGIEL